MTTMIFSHADDVIPMQVSQYIVPTDKGDMVTLNLTDASGGSVSIGLCATHRRASLLAIHDALAKLIDYDTAKGLEAEEALILGGATVSGLPGEDEVKEVA